MDRLSDLPSCLIEMILCFMPIQEAGRTSILSREWRYRWTKIPKLVFKENTFQVSPVYGADSSILEQEDLERQKMDKKSKLIYAVGQVLLMHDGPIREFTLSLVKADQRVKIKHILTEIKHMLTDLSRINSIKKLKLDFGCAGYLFPSSIFLSRQLTDLSLIDCNVYHQPTFNGSSSLTKLYLQSVHISTRTLQRLLSSCPLLKTVILNICCRYNSRMKEGPTFTELLECLPVIETLSLVFDLMNLFEDCVIGRIPEELPTPLVHLKCLSINCVKFTRKEELIMALLIKSSPNLEKLTILDRRMSDTSKKSSSRVNSYTAIMLGHLHKLEIRNFLNHKNRLNFVKLIFARSPVSKKVKIFLRYEDRDKKFQILKILSDCPRASPEVQIIVEDPWC